MCKQKHIASRIILLFLWVVLLCVYGNLKAGQETLPPDIRYSGSTGQQVAPEDFNIPVALSEPDASHQTTTPTNPALLLLLPAYGKEAHLLSQLTPKPSRVKPGCFSLTRQFRILPNAP